MKTITVAELRQNPTDALAAVEQGETYVVTRHRREIGRLVPPLRRASVSATQFASIVESTPVDSDWAEELADTRRAFDGRDNAWDRGK